MKLNQRTLILGAILAVAVVVLALQIVEPVFVVLVLAVVALGGLVAWNRTRHADDADEDEGWDSGDEWGLASAEDDDEEYIDLNDRLAGFAADDRDLPERRGLFAEDQFADDGVVWESDEDEYAATYGATDGATDGIAVVEDDDDEWEYEEYEEEEEVAAAPDLFAPEPSAPDLFAPEPSAPDLVAREPSVPDLFTREPAPTRDDSFAADYAADYGSPTLEEEFEELVEEYAAEEELAEAVDEAVDEYVEDKVAPKARSASIFAAPGIIDEEQVDSDEAILAASKATSLEYDNVLSREDANAETREILSRVASLLAKYE